MFALILSGLLVAALASFLFTWLRHHVGVMVALFSLALFIYFCTFLPEVASGGSVLETQVWIQRMNVQFSFLLDGLSLFFCLLITFFGSLIFLYASEYMREDRHAGRFFGFLTLFMVSMLGLVLADDLVLLFVFWELTSISSYLLIGHEHDNDNARASAQQALLVTAGGGLALMAGFILIGGIAGWSVTEVLAQGDILRDSPYYMGILLLIVLGAFTKSAQFPFHFWLPNAMAAPTPVSAFLHSATMVKAGIYLLARFSPVLAGTPQWVTILCVTGAVTMLIGALLAILQEDIKKLLAYITVSALGMLVFMLGIGSEAAIVACLVFLLAHALYKGAFFMVAGNISHAIGTKKLAKMGGLRSALPVTALTAGLAALSLAGAPPMIGFIGKELLFEAVLASSLLPIPLFACLMLTGMLFVALALELTIGVFFGTSKNALAVHRPNWALKAPPLILAGLGLVAGILAFELPGNLLNQTAIAIMAEPINMHLKLFHGLNLTLLLSGLTLVGGTGLYYLLPWMRLARNRAAIFYRIGPENIFRHSLIHLEKGAMPVAEAFQKGRLRRYIGVILLTFLVLVTAVYVRRDLGFNFDFILPLNHFELVFEVLVAIFILLGVYQVSRTRSRLTLLISMSLMGFGIAIIYIIFSAPDVGITQLVVETLTLVLFIMILHRLPQYRVFKEEQRNWAYLFISVLFGGVMTAILFMVRGYSIESELKKYYLENSLSLGKGENVVNVILVDFRGFDTLGEISVLAIAAIGIAALLGLNFTKEGE